MDPKYRRYIYIYIYQQTQTGMKTFLLYNPYITSISSLFPKRGNTSASTPEFRQSTGWLELTSYKSDREIQNLDMSFNTWLAMDKLQQMGDSSLLQAPNFGLEKIFLFYEKNHKVDKL